MMKRKTLRIILLTTALMLSFTFFTVSTANSNPTIQLAQTDYEVNVFSSSDDIHTNSQWYLENMNVTKAWDAINNEGNTKREVVVAVIDTGVDYTHPDLKKNMWKNPGEIAGDKIDNDNNGYIDDVYGWDFYNNDASVCHYEMNGKVKQAASDDNDDHGTHIAGIIAAVAENQKGIAGVASNINIKIMTLKINGGANGGGRMSDAIKAIQYATMMGADICNISWGAHDYMDGLKDVMKESDMLFVTAAGNYYSNNDEEPVYPASFQLDNQIAVTAVDSEGMLGFDSDCGPETVDLAAPGIDIYSTIVGGYDTKGGTSMAAPQVTAVAALLYATQDHIYASNVKQLLLENLKPLRSLQGFVKNPGIPDAYQLVQSSRELQRDINPPKLFLKTIYSKGNMIIPVKEYDQGNSQIRVIKWIYGRKSAHDFMHGMNGTTVENNQINVSAAGEYTFYASDYAGNETVKTYSVVADTKAPRLTISYIVSEDNNIRTVTVRAKDSQSGIKRIKYMPGVKQAEDFLPAKAGTKILLENGQGTFQVAKDGIYTIFASDNRGNLTIKRVAIKTVRAININMMKSIYSMPVGAKYKLEINVYPQNSTDKITYLSSNPQVATVSTSGEVTAISEGIVYIRAKTSSGLETMCIVSVYLDG